jgi:hypothetical protein
MVVFLVLTIGVAGASNQYEMVLSKDDKLCPSVLSALNQDMAKHGEIRYAGHRAAPVIPWYRMAELGSSLEDSECEQFRWAKFDINNDGKVDLVVKYSSCLEEKLEDELYFFDAGYQGLKSVRTSQEFFKTHGKSGIGFLKFAGGYTLTDLPASHPYFGDERIRTELVLTPFRFKGSTYLHIDPMFPNEFTVLLHVVAKYTREALPPTDKRRADPILPGKHPKGLQDVCYFRVKLDERRVLERAEDGLVLRP